MNPSDPAFPEVTCEICDLMTWAVRYTNRSEIRAPEDEHVLAICEKWGFGAVIEYKPANMHYLETFHPQTALSLISAIRKMKEALEFYAGSWGPHQGYDEAMNRAIQERLNQTREKARQCLEEVFQDE